jgi:uncharacterized membrane protein
MLRSLLIGLTAGSRSLTPLATVSEAARHGDIPNPRLNWLGHPVTSAATKVLAAGELWGDKMKSAPDRIVPAGIAARIVTGALAGAALAPRRRTGLGAVLGAAGAVGAAYVTYHARMAALRRYGQTKTGLVEDALTVAASQMVVGAGRGRR